MSADEIERILDDFAAARWESDPFERFYALQRAGDTAAAARLVELAFERCPQGGTLIDAALSFVTPEAFAELIERALERHRRDEDASDAVANAVLAYGSLQMPELLHPHLDLLFENAISGADEWPWRDAGTAVIPRLRSIILSAEHPTDRFYAWRYLIETRETEALQIALELQEAAGVVGETAFYFEEIGFADPYTPLYPRRPMHILFPDGYFAAPHATEHPSWRADSFVAEARFGGMLSETCSRCRAPLQHLLSLPAAVSPSNAPLTLGACLNCLVSGAIELSYRHGDDGSATPLRLHETPVAQQYRVDAFAETTVRLAWSHPRWRWQEWGLSNGRENLHRIGGHPAWVHSAHYPSCSHCGATMHFLLQLDAGIPTTSGGSWEWGSGGIGYVFWCAGCRVSAVRYQCT